MNQLSPIRNRRAILNKLIFLTILLVLSCLIICPNFGEWHDGLLLSVINNPEFNLFGLQTGRIHFIAVYLFAGKNPYVYFGFKLVIASLACWMLFTICNKLNITKTYALLTALVVSVQPAFIYSYFMLTTSEDIGYFLLLVITYLLILFDDNLQAVSRKLVCALLFILSIVFVFTKESHFILLSVFSMSYLILAKIFSKNERIEHFPSGFVFFSFMGSSALLLLIYYLTQICPEGTVNYMGTNYMVTHTLGYLHPNQSIVSLLIMRVSKAAFKHFINNPIFLAAFIMVLIRVCYKSKYADTAKEIGVYRYVCWADSLIIASFSFMGFHIIFGLNSPRYLLPAYAFLIPALCIYGRVFFAARERQVSLWQTAFPSPIHKKAAVIVLLFLLCNSMLTGINIVIRTKYIPFNMSEMIDKALPMVKRSLDTKRDDENIVFFIVGSTPGIGQFFLLKDNNIDISRFEYKDLPSILHPDNSNDNLLKEPQPGDFILITPHSYKTNIHEAVRNIQKTHNVVLLHKSPSKYYFQLPTLRILVKNIFQKAPDEADFYLYQVM